MYLITPQTMYDFAEEHGLTYLGSDRPKSNVHENWGCPNGHVYSMPLSTLRRNVHSPSKGCVYCHGSSWQYNLEQSGKLQERLAAANAELLGPWRGSKKKHLFRCLTCQHEWQAFGLSVVNQGYGCKKCRKSALKTPSTPQAETLAAAFACTPA